MHNNLAWSNVNFVLNRTPHLPIVEFYSTSGQQVIINAKDDDRHLIPKPTRWNDRSLSVYWICLANWWANERKGLWM